MELGNNKAFASRVVSSTLAQGSGPGGIPLFDRRSLVDCTSHVRHVRHAVSRRPKNHPCALASLDPDRTPPHSISFRGEQVGQRHGRRATRIRDEVQHFDCPGGAAAWDGCLWAQPDPLWNVMPSKRCKDVACLCCPTISFLVVDMVGVMLAAEEWHCWLPSPLPSSLSALLLIPHGTSHTSFID